MSSCTGSFIVRTSLAQHYLFREESSIIGAEDLYFIFDIISSHDRSISFLDLPLMYYYLGSKISFSSRYCHRNTLTKPERTIHLIQQIILDWSYLFSEFPFRYHIVLIFNYLRINNLKKALSTFLLLFVANPLTFLPKLISQLLFARFHLSKIKPFPLKF